MRKRYVRVALDIVTNNQGLLEKFGEGFMAKQRMSDEEFDRQFAEAKRRGDERMATQPRAVEAFYDKQSARVVVHLSNGCTFMFPPELAQGLSGASVADLSEVEILPLGFGLHWEKLDADFSLAGLMSGIFGTKAWMTEMGRKGGSVTSEAKVAAVRVNGAKGGRPRKRA
jgi:hypothetical protein